MSLTNSTAHPKLAPTFVRYSDDLERRDPDEDALIERIVESLHRNNEWAAEKYKHAIRDAHAKGLGVMRGELTVYPNLPRPYRQGLFAKARTYPVLVRLSSTAGALRSDQVGGVRGMAIKVLGVSGDRIIPDGHTNQDFILVNSDTFPFADVRSYAGKGMRFAKILARTPDPLLRTACFLARGASRIFTPLHLTLPNDVQLFARPNDHVLGETYHSAAALRYGDHVAKICITPLSDSVKSLTGQRIPRSAGDDAHRLSVEQFFAHTSADYEVRVQLCTDTEKMPIEDATVQWATGESRHVPVARIRIPRQDTSSTALRTNAEDVVSFNSWTGLADHRPLGSINRLKLRVYNASSEFRHRKNGIDCVEPTTISDIPE
ncbi:catalase family protein [Rhodococcus gordoniae]|uniref:catalase family protein n=1 Tax=Rhodococcus gordoniae TaxID=223392 RepID=UPI0020CDD836|nr:catalase family protein [Rhodococcus gordoniae]UTT49902.1 catalase family protein [Rhodococcus gordoniae]